jgi:hypothetical protein
MMRGSSAVRILTEVRLFTSTCVRVLFVLLLGDARWGVLAKVERLEMLPPPSKLCPVVRRRDWEHAVPAETRSAASLLTLCCRLTSVRAVDPLPEVPGVLVSRLNLERPGGNVFRKFLMRLCQTLLLLRLARSCRIAENPSRSNACFRASQFLQTGHPARTRGEEHARRAKRGAVAAGRSAVAV